PRESVAIDGRLQRPIQFGWKPLEPMILVEQRQQVPHLIRMRFAATDHVRFELVHGDCTTQQLLQPCGQGRKKSAGGRRSVFADDRHRRYRVSPKSRRWKRSRARGRRYRRSLTHGIDLIDKITGIAKAAARKSYMLAIVQADPLAELRIERPGHL